MYNFADCTTSLRSDQRQSAEQITNNQAMSSDRSGYNKMYIIFKNSEHKVLTMFSNPTEAAQPTDTSTTATTDGLTTLSIEI
jgi:hypothetical protein